MNKIPEIPKLPDNEAAGGLKNQVVKDKPNIDKSNILPPPKPKPAPKKD